MKRAAPGIVIFLFTVVSFISCRQSNNSYPYAIRDFAPALRPSLYAIISKGIIYYDSATSFISSHATHEELQQLSFCEHPALRDVALRIMLDRHDFNAFDVIMDHLSDTAIITTSNHESGIQFFRVTDDIIRFASWQNEADKEKTVEEVLMRHNTLQSAYTILGRLQPQEKFYASIKEMAKRDRFYPDIELALYGLAKFRKKEDIPFIQQLLLENSRNLNGYSFAIMREFPHPLYMAVLESYYRKNFFRVKNYEWRSTTHNFTAFIESVAVYRNQRSAEMLDSILQVNMNWPCDADTGHIKHVLVNTVWEKPCPAYSKIRTLVADRIKNQLEIPFETIEYEVPKGPIFW